MPEFYAVSASKVENRWNPSMSIVELFRILPKIFYPGTQSIGRVLSVFSSRQNWDSLTPHPQAIARPLPLVPGGGAHLPAREGVGESQFRRRDIHCGSLYMCVLCAQVERFRPLQLPFPPLAPLPAPIACGGRLTYNCI
jgi:hypothetical protein